MRFDPELYGIRQARGSAYALPDDFAQRGFRFNTRGALVLPCGEEFTALQLEGLRLTRQYVAELERQLRSPMQWPLL
ncbi:MAG: hypothetical protein KY410_07910 [Proteobacteria bacterium]|nr:hypothetical protein [Pseudomonadota bacterium]